MKKVVTSIVLSAVLGLTSLQAKAQVDNLEKSIATNKAATLSQSDVAFLFDNIELNRVAVLGSEEMKETKGEFLGIFSALVGLTSLVFNIGKNRWW